MIVISFHGSDSSKLTHCPHEHGDFCETRRKAAQTVRQKSPIRTARLQRTAGLLFQEITIIPTLVLCVTESVYTF